MASVERQIKILLKERVAAHKGWPLEGQEKLTQEMKLTGNI